MEEAKNPNRLQKICRSLGRFRSKDGGRIGFASGGVVV